MTTRVVNVRSDAYDVYIGRAMPGFPASAFANPNRVGKDGSRKQVIEKYRPHLRQLLESRPELVAELEAMRGKRIGCWCKPSECHGDVLVEWLEGRFEDTPAQSSLFD